MKIGVREIVLIQILPWRVDAAASQSPLPAGCKTRCATWYGVQEKGARILGISNSIDPQSRVLNYFL